VNKEAIAGALIAAPLSAAGSMAGSLAGHATAGAAKAAVKGTAKGSLALLRIMKKLSAKKKKAPEAPAPEENKEEEPKVHKEAYIQGYKEAGIGSALKGMGRSIRKGITAPSRLRNAKAKTKSSLASHDKTHEGTMQDIYSMERAAGPMPEWKPGDAIHPHHRTPEHIKIYDKFRREVTRRPTLEKRLDKLDAIQPSGISRFLDIPRLSDVKDSAGTAAGLTIAPALVDLVGSGLDETWNDIQGWAAEEQAQHYNNQRRLRKE
jgi:hypothetical protein